MEFKKFRVSLCLAVYAVFSWNRLEEILASLISFCCFCLLPIVELTSPDKYWRNDLAEWWIAGIVWLVGAAVIVVHLMRDRSNRKPSSSVQSGAIRFLMMLGFITLTAPFVATLNPNLQGQLTTTRLLPPMSRGMLIETPGINMENQRGILGWFNQANHKLLKNETIIVGGKKSDVVDSSSQTTTRAVTFLFGTDDIGRDVFSRVVFGTRVSLFIGLAAAFGSVLIGTMIGFAAGYSNRIFSSLLMRFTDLVLSIPSLFLLILTIAFLGKSIPILVVLLSLTGWMGIARTVRTEVSRLREQEFVLAAKLLNQSRIQILRQHILPNIRPLLAVALTLQFGNAVLAEASLSFLGLGIQPPTASWGNMLWQSLSSLHSGWWLGFFPGALLATVLIASHYAVEKDESIAP